MLSAAHPDGCTLDDAQQAILSVVVELDAAKAAALGRKAPKPPKGAQLAEQCVQMLSRLNLVERAGAVLRPTAQGSDIATRAAGGDLDAFFHLLWTVFPNFRRLVKLVCVQERPLTLPVDRYGGNFDRKARSEGLTLDQMSFEVIRDLATELHVLNWRPVAVDGRQFQRVYSVGAVAASSKAVLRARQAAEGAPAMPATGGPRTTTTVLYNVPDYPGDLWTFAPYVVPLDVFEQELWRNYMSLTDRVPRFPVLYADLRDNVCEHLAISDASFDLSLQELVQRPRRLDVFPAEGILDHSAKLAIAYKQVPPRTPAGQFMTFLKLDRRRPT